MESGPDNTKLTPEQAGTGSEGKGTPSLLVAALQREHPEWVREVITAHRETTIVVPREQIEAVCSFLKTAPDTWVDFLADIFGTNRAARYIGRVEPDFN